MSRWARRLVTVPVLGGLALAMPAAALACSIAAGPINHVPVPRSQVVVPLEHDSAREAWKLHPSWRSIRPELSSGVRVVGGSKDGRWGVARKAQRLLTFTAMHRYGARRWYDDTDPETTCARRGEQVYAKPRLVVRQSERAVFVTFVTRRQPDPAGCVSWAPGDAPLPGGQMMVAGSCDDVAWGRVVLKQPLGDRRLVLDRFGPTDDDTTA